MFFLDGACPSAFGWAVDPGRLPAGKAVTPLNQIPCSKTSEVSLFQIIMQRLTKRLDDEAQDNTIQFAHFSDKALLF